THQDGGWYNPLTDTWREVSRAGEGPPAFVTGQTAVWTGSALVFWGGSVETTGNPIYFNSGLRYDPSTQSWTATSRGGNRPSPRGRHTAVWTGNRMIVWGGQGAGGWLNDGG